MTVGLNSLSNLHQTSVAATAPKVPDSDARLMAAARNLESTFLSEMLKHAGLGESAGAFGGGAGEDQFASLLRDAQASAIVQAGGVGLAQSLFEALKEANDGK